MSAITVTYQFGTSERLMRPTILERFLQETGFGFVSTFTATASATSVTDTVRWKSSLLAVRDAKGGWIRLVTGTGAGEIRAVTNLDATTGVLTTDAFSGTPTNGATYEFWKTILHPQTVLDMLDTLISKELYFPRWSYLSEVDDFDMEASGITGYWVAGTGATVTKRTAQPLMGGKQYLRVLADATGNRYAEINSPLAVEPSTEYHISAIARCQDKDTEAKLIGYDHSNSAEIGSTTFTRVGNVRACVQNLITPASCHQLQLRLQTVTASKYSEWDDVLVYPVAASSIALPSWVQDGSQVRSYFRYSDEGLNQSAGNVLWSASMAGRREFGFNSQDVSFSGDGRGRAFSTGSTRLNWPLFIFGVGNETAFSSDTEEKYIDANHIHANLCFKVYDSLIGYPGTGVLDMKIYEERRKTWETRKNQQNYAHANRIEQVMEEPVQRVSYR